MSRKSLSVLLAIAAVTSAATLAETPTLGAPEPVSPGSRGAVETVADVCPTFSWSALAGARGYLLVVYEVGAEGELGAAVIERRLAAGVSSWTPPLRQALTAGTAYAWTVGAMPAGGEPHWSEPAMFRVATAGGIELERALEVVRRYLMSQRAETAAAPVEGASEARNAERTTVSSLARAQQLPESPATVSLVTDGAVGVGTSAPLADLHVMGGPATAGILLSPDSTDGSGTSEILLSRDEFGFDGARLRYDGPSGKLQIWGRDSDVDQGPWLEISSPDGQTFFGGEMFGRGSGLTNVDAETLDGMDSSDFSAGAHTVDTTCLDAGVNCAFAASSSEGGAASSGDSATGFFSEGQIEESRIADSIARDSEVGLQLSRLWRCFGGWRYADMGDGTVLDCATGLYWLRNANCFGVETWQAAKDAAAALNSGECGLSDGSEEGDWRLPEAGEWCSSWVGGDLQPCPAGAAADSLIDSSLGPPTVSNAEGDGAWSPGDPFVSVLSTTYWAQTDQTGPKAWQVDLSIGWVGVISEGVARNVWPLRESLQ